jgi:hypothetical protein
MIKLIRKCDFCKKTLPDNADLYRIEITPPIKNSGAGHYLYNPDNKKTNMLRQAKSFEICTKCYREKILKAIE